MLSPYSHGISDFVVIPGTSIAVHAATVLSAGAVASEEVGQVVSIDEFEDVLLVLASTNLDLVSCSLIKETLYNSPNTSKKHRSIYYKHLSHDFWVVVLTNFACQLDECINLL